MKVKVYLAKESPFAQALHSATLTLASEVLACGMAKKLAWDKASKAIQLTVALTWREVKDTVRPAKIKGRPIPVVKGTEAGNLDLSYPEAGRETVRHPHEATRRECRLAQARKLAAKRASVAQAQ